MTKGHPGAEFRSKKNKNKKGGGMTIIERDNKDGTKGYQVQIVRKGLKRINKTFPNRPEAERFNQHILNSLNRPPPRVNTLADAERLRRLNDTKLVDLLANFTASDAVRRNHLNILPSIVLHIGNIKVGQIRKSWVKNFISKIRGLKSRKGQPYADGTIAAMIWTMNAAVKWQADELDLPRLDLSLSVNGLRGEWDNKRDRRLSKDEEAAILARMNRIEGITRVQWMSLFQLALETAARQSELTRATWSEFDLAKRVWLIPKKRTKSKKTRGVPLTLKAVEMLTQLQAEAIEGNPRVFPLLGTQSNTVSTCFRRYALQAGVEDFRFHDLRHEATSRMALYWRKFTMFEIMLIVGHTRMEMFQRYANLRADELAMKLDF